MSGPRPLLVILAAALLIRCTAAVVVDRQLDGTGRRFLVAGDAEGYWELGSRLAAGETYEIRGAPGDRLAQAAGPRRVSRMPGFPAMLAVPISLFGDRVLAARLFLAVVGTVACGLVYLLGTRLFDSRTGTWSAAIAAASPALAGSSVLILSEMLFATCLLAGLVAAAGLLERGGAVRAMTCGAAMALAVYVRPGWLLAVPGGCLLLIWSSHDRRRAAIDAGLVLAVLALALAPWTWRNFQVTGHPVVTTLWVGPSLYDGLNPQATGSSEMSFIIAEGLFADRAYSEYAIDRHYRQRAWQFVGAHPGRTLELAAIKLWRFLKPWPSAAEIGREWQRALVAGCSLAVLILAARGGWQQRQNRWRWLLTAGPLIYLAALHLVFVGSMRYRLPAEYPLCVLAAVGLLTCWDRRGSGESANE